MGSRPGSGSRAPRGQRPLQLRHRPGTELRRLGARGLRRRRQALEDRLHRCAARDSPALPILHRGEDGAPARRRLQERVHAARRRRRPLRARFPRDQRSLSLMPDFLLAIPYPRIDPTAFAIGPFTVRWYALAYVAGLVFAWWHIRSIVAARPQGKRIMEPKDVDDLLFWATFGVVLGGRFGYVLFYKPGYYIEHLDEV